MKQRISKLTTIIKIKIKINIIYINININIIIQSYNIQSYTKTSK